jgi:NAD(P)H-dependent flavin oxidoreductase YrpB (nitropropane dioxygenase family)
MYTDLCRQASIDVPVFAFTHSRRVAVEVSKAGGMGCLGTAFMTAHELKDELDWMDERVGDKPYGISIMFNPRRPGKGTELTIEQVDDEVWSSIPDRHRRFTEKLLSDHCVPEWPERDKAPSLGSMVYEMSVPVFEEALRHRKCKVLVSALGTPPADIVDKAHAAGWLVGAMSGTRKHALKHKAAGLDFVVANGSEGGGHIGAVGSIVLWPALVDAVAPLPVLAAGGVGNGRQLLAALAIGAQGVWTGTLWVTVEEAGSQPKQKQRYLDADIDDTVITRAWSGKTARFLRNRWTDAWVGPESPGVLPNPAQWLLTADARRRVERFGEVGDVQEIGFSAAGQVIGLINEVETCRDVVSRLKQEYADAFGQLARLAPKH